MRNKNEIVIWYLVHVLLAFPDQGLVLPYELKLHIKIQDVELKLNTQNLLTI